jgi:hypothetical protein
VSASRRGPPAEVSETVDVDGVRFEGAFRPVEREFLAAQFGACRFRLLARSALTPDLALVEWEGAPLPSTGPRPIVSAPRRATYVLDAAAGVTGRDWSGLRLEPVVGGADLAARFPGHFPAVRIRVDWRDRLRRAVRDVWPALMLAVATLWVLAVVWSCRPFG